MERAGGMGSMDMRGGHRMDSMEEGFMAGLLEKAGLRGAVLASGQLGVWCHLLEVEGFVTQADEPVIELSRLSGVERATVIGAYANPMTGDTA